MCDINDVPSFACVWTMLIITIIVRTFRSLCAKRVCAICAICVLQPIGPEAVKHKLLHEFCGRCRSADTDGTESNRNESKCRCSWLLLQEVDYCVADNSNSFSISSISIELISYVNYAQICSVRLCLRLRLLAVAFVCMFFCRSLPSSAERTFRVHKHRSSYSDDDNDDDEDVCGWCEGHRCDHSTRALVSAIVGSRESIMFCTRSTSDSANSVRITNPNTSGACLCTF